MFRDFMNNDCQGGNTINKFTNSLLENRIGSQQQESWTEELQNFDKQPHENNFGEIYNNMPPNQIMRFNGNENQRMFEMGRQNMGEKVNTFYFSEDEMLNEYQQFRPKQRHQMRSNNQQMRNHNPREEWGEEYNQMQGNNAREEWAEDYQRTEGKWSEEYDNDWTGEYQSKVGEMEDEYERAYNEEQSKDWTSEYEDYNLDKAYEEEQQEQEDDEWFDSYLKNEKQFSEESMKSVTQQLLSIDDPKLQNSNFMKFIEKVHTGEYKFEGNTLVTKHQRDVQHKNVSWADDYNEFQEQQMVNDYHSYQHQPNEINEMVNEYQNFHHEPKNEMVEEYLQDIHDENKQDELVNEYQGYVKDEEDDEYQEIWNEEGSWNTEYLSSKEYLFNSENPYLNLEHPYEKGLEFMDNGRIKDAILAFEAEVAKNPENVKAWHMLGKAHAEGDKDDQAIEALKRAIKLQPDNLECYIDIAVSYTNTMHKDKALQALEQWLSRNSKYQSISNKFGFRTSDNWLDNYGGLSLKSMYERHDYVANTFIEAAQLQPNDIDADIQIILGLLYNISMDYDKAIECFRAALNKKPGDYTLWNKLGATLANNNRSGEAVDAYLNALEQKPLYVRAIANLGISFVALNQYEDAAKQFLSALSLEPNAKHIWSNLENSFSFMDRQDLVDKIGDLNPEVFRKYFDF